MVTGLLFYAFAAILIVAALGVITARNPVHSALFLVLAFAQSAVLWLLIEAEFLAITLVLVYVMLGLGLTIPDESGSPVSGIIDLCLAGLLYIVGVAALLNRPRRAMDAVTRPRPDIGLRGGLALGAGLGITNPSSLIPYTSDLKDLSVAGIGVGGVALGDAVFLLILMAPMVAPLIVVHAFPRTSDRALARLSALLVRHGHFLMGAMSTGFAVYLTVKGVVEIRPFI